MKIKMPEFVKNMSKRAIIIWVVSFVGVLVIGFGTPMAVMAMIKKNYGIELNYDNIVRIVYMNEQSGKELFNKADARHANAMREIVTRLNKARQTNQLMNFFRGRPESYSVGQNTTRINYNEDFKSKYESGGLMIWFHTPMYHVTQSTTQRYAYDLNPGDGEGGVWGIFIPLDNVEDRMQEQTWFLLTTERDIVTGTYISIPNKVSTWGNYKKLWDYVNELNVLG
jgi:hypothetical protein